MTVSHHNNYYYPSSKMNITKYHSLKTQVAETVTETYTVYSSDDEFDDDDATMVGSGDYKDEMDTVPLLIEDEDEYSQLMQICVKLVSSWLYETKPCSCCSTNTINMVLTRLLQKTGSSLNQFSHSVVLIYNNLLQNDSCIKYIILGVMVNNSELSINEWSNLLKISPESLQALSFKYDGKLGNNEIAINNFKSELKLKIKQSGDIRFY